MATRTTRVACAQTYGDASDPNVLRWEEKPLPLIEAVDDILIEVRAVKLDPFDMRVVAGGYWPVFRVPVSPGFDYAGVVAEVHPAQTEFAVGDLVYGVLLYGGAIAERLVTKRRYLSRIPAELGLSFAQASTIGVALLTAEPEYWKFKYKLDERLSARGGGKVGHMTFNLVHFGSSGGIGLKLLSLIKSLVNSAEYARRVELNYFAVGHSRNADTVEKRATMFGKQRESQLKFAYIAYDTDKTWLRERFLDKGATIDFVLQSDTQSSRKYYNMCAPAMDLDGILITTAVLAGDFQPKYHVTDLLEKLWINATRKVFFRLGLGGARGAAKYTSISFFLRPNDSYMEMFELFNAIAVDDYVCCDEQVRKSKKTQPLVETLGIVPLGTDGQVVPKGQLHQAYEKIKQGKGRTFILDMTAE